MATRIPSRARSPETAKKTLPAFRLTPGKMNQQSNLQQGQRKLQQLLRRIQQLQPGLQQRQRGHSAALRGLQQVR